MADLKTKRTQGLETAETFPLTVEIEGLGAVSLRYRRSGIKGSTLRRVVGIQKSAKAAEATGDELQAAEAVLESLTLRAEGLIQAVASWDLEDDGQVIPLTLEECQRREDDEAFWEVAGELMKAIGAALSPNPPTPTNSPSGS